MNFRVKKGKGVRGEITIPGDKSISHRSIMCASLADGTSKIYGFLEGEDCLATMRAFEEMGINFERNNDEIIVHGSGLHGLRQPKKEINLGNSGTSIRLLRGILSAQKFSSTLIGDQSLSSRPSKVDIFLAVETSNLSSLPSTINTCQHIKIISILCS